MGVHPAVLHPGKGKQQTAAVCFFVGIVETAVAVGKTERTMIQFLIAGEYGIEHRDILVGRTDNQAHRLIPELFCALIEPVRRLDGRTFVIQREHDEAVLQGVFPAESLQQMPAGSQVAEAVFIVLRRNVSICLDFILLLSVDGIGDVSINLFTHGISPTEAHGLQLTLLHLLWHVHIDGSRTGTYGNEHAAFATLASLISHISLHHEVIITCRPTVVILENQRNGNHESAVAIGLKFSVGDLRGILALVPSPVPTLTLHLVFHLGALNGYTGKTLGYALNHQRVACLIGGLHFVKRDFIRWTLVLFHPDGIVTAVMIRAQGELPRESCSRQIEIGGSRSIAVGREFLFRHFLSIGIPEDEGERHIRTNTCIHAFTCHISQN